MLNAVLRLTQILRERLEFHLPRTSFVVIAGVGRVLHQRALDHAVVFLAGLLARRYRDRPSELVPDSVHHLGFERQMIARKGGRVEELVDELTLVAVSVPESRDETGDLAIFHRELHEE